MRPSTFSLSLRGKAALFIVILSMLGLSGLALMLFRTQKALLSEFEEEKMSIIEHFVIGTLKPVMLTGHGDVMSSIIASLKKTPDIKGLTIIRSNGVEAFTDGATMKKVNERVGEERFSRELKEAVRVLPESDPMLQNVLRSATNFAYSAKGPDGNRVTFMMIPILNESACHACHGDDHKVRGILLASFGMTADDRQTLDNIFKFSGLSFVLFLLTSALTFVFINRLMANRISRIVDQVSDLVSEERFDRRIIVDAEDEVGQLAISFNHFISSVELYRIEETKEKERLEAAVFEKTKALREKNDFIESDLILARRIQQKLMPDKFPPLREVDFHATYIPCLHIGGDYYDVFEMPNQHVGVFMADASGHGSSAALLVSIVKAIVSTAGKDISSPSYVVNIINNTLARITPDDSFVTIFYGVIDLKTGIMRYSLAGHPPPVVYNLKSGVLVNLETNGNLVGIFDFDKFDDSIYVLQPADRLFIYTDGIVEAASENGDMFGKVRMENVIRSKPGEPAAEMVRRLLSELETHMKGAALVDDITLLVVDYKKE